MYEYACRVERVIDGDSLRVFIDLGFNIWIRETVRLSGIDTPEVFGRQATEAGIRARAYTAWWVASAERFRLVSERYDEREKYGRVLGRLYRDDDPLSLNEALRAAGHAKPL